MKTKQEILNEIIRPLQEERKRLWVFYHECQEWDKQKEAVLPYDEIISYLKDLLWIYHLK